MDYSWVPTLIVGVLAPAAAFAAAWFVFVRRGQEITLTAEEQQTKKDDAKTALDARIDERVQLQLEKAWKRIDEQDQKLATQQTTIDEQGRTIEEQGREIKTLTDSALNVKEIVRRWFNVLRAWDGRGRKGDLPLPSPDDMVRLDLDQAA